MGSRLMVKGMTVCLIILMVTACGAPETPMPVAAQPSATSVPTASATLSLTPTPVPTATVTPTTIEASTSTPTLTSTPTSTPTATPSPTPLPRDVPPIVVIHAPQEVTTGERAVLDASRTFDHDGDAISFSWSQVQNPDRYEGTEYLTGIDAELTTNDGPIVTFVPKWPGHYRFEVTASDKDGDSRDTIDVIAYPSQDIFAMRGMAIDGRNGSWSEPEASKALDYLKALGFNYVQIGIHDTMESPTSNEILIDQCRDPWVLTLDQNVALIELAKDAGFGVMISPHLGCTIGGTWYEAYNILPADPGAWFQSYRQYSLFYAELAQDLDIEILNLGGGMHQFYGFDDGWKQLLTDIRGVYSGKVAFSWFDFPPWSDRPEFPHVEEVDILVNAFNWNGSGTSLTGSRSGNSYPGIDEMVGYFETELERYLDGLQAQHGKSVIATDLYPWPVDGMNIDPVALYWTNNRPVDNQEPIDYAEAAFVTMANRHWQGVFLWSLKIGPPSSGEPETRGKPIEQMLQIWFSPRSD